ncbi:MAG: DUF935 family protein, partial [Opitutae bacterium]|nr:DUF935 family protein [Opitutae bacterium]
MTKLGKNLLKKAARVAPAATLAVAMAAAVTAPITSKALVSFRKYQKRVFWDHVTKTLIIHWSRQVGKSYTLAAWAVDRLLMNPGRLVTVLSNSRANGLEFVLKCQEVCRKLGQAIELESNHAELDKRTDISEDMKYDLMRGEVRITVEGVVGRILVLAANPRTARGFSGDLIMDEFAFHENSAAIWEAAEPIISSNPDFLCRIASTGNGKRNMFFQLISEGRIPYYRVRRSDAWAAGEIKIYSAVTGKEITPAQARAEASDKRAYDQNYECMFNDENTALLTQELINAAQREGVVIEDQSWSEVTLVRLATKTIGVLSVGQDVGRNRDLSVQTVLETIGNAHRVVAMLRMENMRLPAQCRELKRIATLPKFVRGEIDMTGITDHEETPRRRQTRRDGARHRDHGDGDARRVRGSPHRNPDGPDAARFPAQAGEDREPRRPGLHRRHARRGRPRRRILVRRPRDSRGHASRPAADDAQTQPAMPRAPPGAARPERHRMSLKLKTETAKPFRRKLPAGTILNSSGKAVTPSTASGSRTLAQKVAALSRFREQFNPLQALTLAKAVRLAGDYFRGDMADLQWTFFFIEQTDPDLMALLELRLGRLIEMDYNISAEEDADEKLADEQRQCLEEKFAAIDNLYDSIEHFGYAPFRGFAHCEKWISGGELTHLEIVDQWNVVRDGLVGEWKYNPSAKSTSFRALGDEQLMPQQNFIFRQVRRPINRIALYKFVRDNLANVDWDAFNAIFGIPSGVIIGPPDVPADREAEYESSANEIAEGGSGYLPHGSTYTQNKAPGGTNPFKERLDYLSQRLVLAGTSGKLTMLTEAGSGTLAGGAHSDVLDAVVAADARRISEVFNRQLVKPWLEAAFPGKPQLAYFGLAANEETDVSQIITDIKTLSDAGFQVDPQQASQKTGYTLTLKAAPLPGNAQQFPGQTPAGQQDGTVIANRRIVNRAGTAGREARFLAKSQANLTAADQVALKPAIERVAALDAITDDAEFAKAYGQFLADLPA